MGIRGVVGARGAPETRLFARRAINPSGFGGFFFGRPVQLRGQFISVAATMLFAFSITFIILTAIGPLTGLRVSEEEDENQSLMNGIWSLKENNPKER